MRRLLALSGKQVLYPVRREPAVRVLRTKFVRDFSLARSSLAWCLIGVLILPCFAPVSFAQQRDGRRNQDLRTRPLTKPLGVQRPKTPAAQPGGRPQRPGYGGDRPPGQYPNRGHRPNYGYHPRSGYNPYWGYRPGLRHHYPGWYSSPYGRYGGRRGVYQPYYAVHPWWNPVHSVFFGAYSYPLGVFPPTVVPFIYSGFYSSGFYGAGVPAFGPGPPLNVTPSILPGRPPQSTLLDSKLVRGPDLPPARVQLQNSTRRPLQVAVVDLIDQTTSQSLRIPPRSQVEVKLARTAGATRISQYRTYDEYGLPVVREIVTEVDPPVRYELAVHEWAMQSVAIDRTGKSPNPIEDINMQGRGIGRFPLPAGEQLQSGSIDVMQAALAANNPGAVGPLPSEGAGPISDNASILERAVLEAQQRAIRGARP